MANQPRGDFAAVEKISTVHHAVHPAQQGGHQGALKIGEKFRSSSASLNSRAKRKIKAQVCISQKQDADYTHRSALITSRRFSVTLGLRRSLISRPSESSRRSSVVTTRSRS